jgi:DNA-directed RNA polymerase subunit F
MLKKTTLVLLVIGSSFSVLSQKKKDLIEEVAQLKDSVMVLNDSISKANRQVNISEANATLFEKENKELRDANATLLQNLNSFSKISKQNTETVNNALASLKEKQEQMGFITNDFSKNDSIAIVILTQAKQTLGQDAKVGIGDGDVIFSNSLDFLFGNDSGTQLTEGAKTLLVKIGEIIVANPDRSISVEGLNITGEFGLTYQQTLAVANALLTVEGVTPESLHILAKDGNFKEGVNIRLSSDAKGFYKKLKSEFK